MSIEDRPEDPTGAKPDVWLDSCVLLDFFSLVSLHKNQRGGSRSIAATFRAMQHAAWLAMAFDEREIRSVSYTHETEDTIGRRAKVAPSLGEWTGGVMAKLVKPNVCPRWRTHWTEFGATYATATGLKPTPNDVRDQWMIEYARDEALQGLITTDRGALNRARRLGLTAWRPEEYAATILPIAIARERFLRRLDAALMRWTSTYLNAPTFDAAEWIWRIYSAVWSAGASATGLTLDAAAPSP